MNGHGSWQWIAFDYARHAMNEPFYNSISPKNRMSFDSCENVRASFLTFGMREIA